MMIVEYVDVPEHQYFVLQGYMLKNIDEHFLQRKGIIHLSVPSVGV